MPYFASLWPDVAHQVATGAVLREIQPGQGLCTQGAPANSMLIVLQGHALVYMRGRPEAFGTGTDTPEQLDKVVAAAGKANDKVSAAMQQGAKHDAVAQLALAAAGKAGCTVQPQANHLRAPQRIGPACLLLEALAAVAAGQQANPAMISIWQQAAAQLRGGDGHVFTTGAGAASLGTVQHSMLDLRTTHQGASSGHRALQAQQRCVPGVLALLSQPHGGSASGAVSSQRTAPALTTAGAAAFLQRQGLSHEANRLLAAVMAAEHAQRYASSSSDAVAHTRSMLFAQQQDASWPHEMQQVRETHVQPLY